MSFSKRVQVLFLVSLCLTTFSCANRDLVDHTPADQQNHTTTKAGGGSGESGSGASIASAVVTGPGHVDEFGATNCGCHQPWYHPKPQPQPQPQPPCCGGGCGCPSVPGGSCGGGGGGPPSGGCGGSSCGGSSDGCGGNSPGGGCNNGGCQPPPITCPVGCVPAFGYGQWAYHWPMPSPGVGYMGTQSDPNQAGPNQENQNGDAMNNGSNPPMEMEKEKQDDQHNSGSSSINKGKHD